ncbi:nicotinate (nicotinamide) nucleotide adenylyltransferase [Reichenbachiella versicolor]|uniref:nicotinate (nicotinamide) nucleotide adenylyltransferase n=1 Tax=Reichenbachiella versicolor TaxID=1821036 RepID=UPI000D6EA1A7|nr:nicotinate (nicotinamide) nucleotide adenylyltransferase [Reichenbachiella versicolor]
MKVGLFFGSFNPIHVGHMIIAQTMLESGNIDELWFVVSPQNPFKKNTNLLHEFERFDMVQAATFDNPRFKVSDVEFHISKPSYTIDTLTVLSDKFRSYDFKLIIGGDNLTHFHKWKNYKEILKQYELLVYPRPSAKTPSFECPDTVKFIDAPQMQISATFIRDRIRSGYSIRYLVPKEVEELILSRKLFV